MKRTLISIAMVAALSLSTAQAKDNAWEKDASDAWIDGKAEATLLFNPSINSFKIDTDVKNGVVLLTGNVDHSVDKKLARELVLGIKGVKDVDNQIVVTDGVDRKTLEKNRGMSESGFTDVKIATVIKTRLLFDGDISGTKINVDVKDNNVTLTGDVPSQAVKDLALNIAKNADDVKSVKDNLKVVKGS